MAVRGLEDDITIAASMIAQGAAEDGIHERVMVNDTTKNSNMMMILVRVIMFTFVRL